MCRNPQKATLFKKQRTAHGVCLPLFERYCAESAADFGRRRAQWVATSREVPLGKRDLLVLSVRRSVCDGKTRTSGQARTTVNTELTVSRVAVLFLQHAEVEYRRFGMRSMQKHWDLS